MCVGAIRDEPRNGCRVYVRVEWTEIAARAVMFCGSGVCSFRAHRPMYSLAQVRQVLGILRPFLR